MVVAAFSKSFQKAVMYDTGSLLLRDNLLYALSNLPLSDEERTLFTGMLAETELEIIEHDPFQIWSAVQLFKKLS
jgi:hypothetical protein